jgi:hypothetical protein
LVGKTTTVGYRSPQAERGTRWTPLAARFDNFRSMPKAACRFTWHRVRQVCCWDLRLSEMEAGTKKETG